MENTVIISGEEKTPYQMTNRDAVALSKQVLNEVEHICRDIDHNAAQNTPAATRFQRTMASDDLAKNQLNWASAYATNVISRPNVSTDEKVKWACQAQGCLNNAKGFLQI